MVLLQISFWLRVFLTTVAIGYAGSVVAMPMGWGSCVPRVASLSSGPLAPLTFTALLSVAMMAVLGARKLAIMSSAPKE